MTAPSLFVAMPTRGHAYVPSVLQALAFARLGSSPERPPLFEIGGPIDVVRTRIAERFLASDATHLVMLDDDVVAPDGTLERLLALEAPIATAACPFAVGGRVFLNAKPVGTDEWPTRPEPRVFEARHAGLACALIAREVFAQIPPPWFWMALPPNGRGLIGEDVWFCNRLRDAGVPILCDGTAICSHVKDGVDLAVLAGWTRGTGQGSAAVRPVESGRRHPAGAAHEHAPR